MSDQLPQPRSFPQPKVLPRDGTRQDERMLPALEPGYVSVDERTAQDVLRFAREYGKGLTFVDGEIGETRKDWSHFFGDEFEKDEVLDQVVAFMEDPNGISNQRLAELFARPHFVLFLSFLQLFAHAQGQLNQLTRRHLDFYYRQFLGMTRKQAVADRLNVIFQPVPGVDRFKVPAGSLLSAGQDSLGQDQFYQTDNDIVVSQAQVVRKSSVYVHRQITGLGDARVRKDENDQIVKTPIPEALLGMLQIALGDPSPGDPLQTPQEPLLSLLQAEAQGKPDLAFVWSVVDQVEHGEQRLCMSESDFRTMMQRKQQAERPEADPSQWHLVNHLLETAGQTKRNDPAFRLEVDDPIDFETNLLKALGGEETPPGGEIAAEKSVLIVVEQHDALLRAIDDYFHMRADDLKQLRTVAEMPIVTDREWVEVDRLLTDAHREMIYAARREALKKRHQKNGFVAMIQLASGDDTASDVKSLRPFVSNNDDYEYLKDIGGKPEAKVASREWNRVYSIVERAQRNREQFPEPIAQKVEWRNLYPAADATTLTVNPNVEADEDSPRWETFGRKVNDFETEYKHFKDLVLVSAHVKVDVGSYAVDAGGNVGGPDDSSEGPDEITYGAWLPQECRPGPLPSDLGWALSSPSLELSQGQRRVTLRLEFGAAQFDGESILKSLQRSPFQVEVSTEKGWIAPSYLQAMIPLEPKPAPGDAGQVAGDTAGEIEEIASNAIVFALDFDQEVDPIVALPAEDAQIKTAWPVLRLMVRQLEPPPESGEKGDSDNATQNSESTRTVPTPVLGLTEFQIQSDVGVLDSKSPFEPFGPSPAVGSRFYLGHPELVRKRLEKLRFQLEWMGVPTDLTAHYKNYDLIGKSFTANVSLVDKNVATPLGVDDLFASLTAAATPHSMEIASASLKEVSDELAVAGPLGEDLREWHRYLRWELKDPDFQHQVYPSLATSKAVELAARLANPSADRPSAESDGEIDPNGNAMDPKDYIVNPPYTPTIKRLSIDYSASATIRFEDYQRGTFADRVFHIHPFGHHEVHTDRSPNFLPQYNNEGELYLGIDGVQAPQHLSILFQMAEGSADPDLEPEPVQWSYLSDDCWISLHEGDILSDTTRGLINSGIIEFRLAAAQPSKQLPVNLYWLRAAIAWNSNSVCDTVDIHTQAVSTTFVDTNNAAADHYSRPLPASSIEGLVDPLPEIAGVEQPYTSFGGRAAEQDEVLYRRVSERLRHKQRALNVWDYERLVLEQFPQIYLAKCLTANLDDSENWGHVEIVVIPQIHKQLEFDPFEPKAPADLLADIETYLADKIPPAATVKARNASFVQVKVGVSVQFKPESDEELCKRKLNEEINRFLSPWAYDEAADIVIGGKIYANSIVDFIDRLEFVDFVGRVDLFSSRDNFDVPKDVIEADPSQADPTAKKEPDIVLVAARQHEVALVSETDDEAEGRLGINYMEVGKDFMVG